MLLLPPLLDALLLNAWLRKASSNSLLAANTLMRSRRASPVRFLRWAKSKLAPLRISAMAAAALLATCSGSSGSSKMAGTDWMPRRAQIRVHHVDLVS